MSELDEKIAMDPAIHDMLILVDGLDREVGQATKLDAHVDGTLHRAFSALLYRDGEHGPELLLAKRSLMKYHSGGLWANSCCSHPRVGEDIIEAAYRRVPEEIGCQAVQLRDIASFVYRAKFDNGLTEHEFDHVILGKCEGDIVCNPMEASEARWVTFEQLARELATEPEKFAAWAPIVFTLAMAELSGK